MAKVKLSEGKKAPSFSELDITGKRIKLADYKGKKILLCFFRYAGCPWCNLAVHRLIAEYPKLNKLGLEIITFIQSKPENIDKFILNNGATMPPFPIIADPMRKIYSLYGVEESYSAALKSIKRIPDWFWNVIGKKHIHGKMDGSLSLVPAEFMIGPDEFKLYKVHYGVDYFDHLAIAEILEFAQFNH